MTSLRSAFVLFAVCAIATWRVDWHPLQVSAPLFVGGHRDAAILHYPPPLAPLQAVLAAWLVSTANLLAAVILTIYPPGPRLERFRRGPAGALTLALLMGVAANVAVHRCGMSEKPLVLPDPELQWRPAPFAEVDPGIFLNARGLRTDEVGPRREGRIRVLVVGDSATWGASPGKGRPAVVPYPQQMERLGREQGLDIEVVNGAVIGYSSLQGRRMLPELLDAYRPDILLFGYNNDGMPDGGMPDRLRTNDKAWVRRCQSWLYRCDLYLLLRQHLMGRLAAPSGSDSGAARVSVEEHVENYRAFIEAARARGVTPCILILPTEHIAGYDDADRALAAETGCQLIDLHVLMARMKRPSKELLPDALHPIQEAQVALAEIILEALFPKGGRR